jgi:hypothetical protein
LAIEDILSESVDLDVLSEIVAGRDIDTGVAAEFVEKVRVVAEIVLARCGNQVRTDFPPRCQPVVEPGLEAVVGDAGDVVSGQDVMQASSLMPTQGPASGLAGEENSLAVSYVAFM